DEGIPNLFCMRTWWRRIQNGAADRQQPSLSLIDTLSPRRIPTMRYGKALLVIMLLICPPAAAQECVVLLHGLARTESSFFVMEEVLEASGYQVVNEGYPSTRAPIEALLDNVRESVALCDDANRL